MLCSREDDGLQSRTNLVNLSTLHSLTQAHSLPMHAFSIVAFTASMHYLSRSYLMHLTDSSKARTIAIRCQALLCRSDDKRRFVSAVKYTLVCGPLRQHLWVLRRRDDTAVIRPRCPANIACGSRASTLSEILGDRLDSLKSEQKTIQDSFRLF